MKEIYLNEDQVLEKTVIMVDFKDKPARPYLVWKKEIQPNGLNALCGEFLEHLIMAPHIFPVRKSTSMKLYFEKINYAVAGYQKISENEKETWVKKIEPINNLSEVVKIIQSS